MGMRRALAIFLCGACLPLSHAIGASVVSRTEALGNGSWRFEYTLFNAGPSLSFDELTIYFGSSFSGLMSASGPAGWDLLVVPFDAAIPSEGFFDALNRSGLVPAGASTQFSITVSSPNSFSPQRFDLINSSTFSVVGTGLTTLAVAAVPEPEDYALLLLGLACLTASQIWRRRGLPVTGFNKELPMEAA